MQNTNNAFFDDTKTIKLEDMCEETGVPATHMRNLFNSNSYFKNQLLWQNPNGIQNSHNMRKAPNTAKLKIEIQNDYASKIKGLEPVTSVEEFEKRRDSLNDEHKRRIIAKQNVALEEEKNRDRDKENESIKNNFAFLPSSIVSNYGSPINVKDAVPATISSGNICAGNIPSLISSIISGVNNIQAENRPIMVFSFNFNMQQ